MAAVHVRDYITNHSSDTKNECSCSCVGKPSIKTPPEIDDFDDEYYRKYRTCCGMRRRLICGNFFFPPRRTHDNHQTYASIMTPICFIMIALCSATLWFITRNHSTVHSSLKILTYVVTISASLFSITIVLTVICLMSWIKSTSCFHRRVFGEFEDTEKNYVIGSTAADDIVNGQRPIVFFSAVPALAKSMDVSTDETIIGGDFTYNELIKDYEPESREGEVVDDLESQQYDFIPPNRKPPKISKKLDMAENVRKYEFAHNQFSRHMENHRKYASMVQLVYKSPFLNCCFPDE